MRIKKYGILIVVLLLFNLDNHGYAQSPSEFALIKQPILENPTTYKLTTTVTNQRWNVDLYLYPHSSVLSYIALPNYQVLSSVSFSVDRAWNRTIYVEGLDIWIRAYGLFGQGVGLVKRPRSIESLAPCNDDGYSNYYYVYIADTDNDRIVRYRYDWRAGFQNIIWDSPITGLGLVRPVDINLNDGGSFYTIGEDNFPSSQNNYLWVVNSPGGIPSEIKRITVDGVLKHTYGTYGCTGLQDEFCRITAVVSGRNAFSPRPYSNNTHFYVADPGNNRVVWLAKTFGLETITWYGEVPASSSFIDLEVDHFGHLWVLDQDAGKVTKYTSDLFPLCTFGSTGLGENEFMMPVSISDPVGYLGAANMYIVEDWSESSGGQYFAIGTDVVDFAVTSSFEEHIHYVDFVLVSPSKVTINVHDDQGALVKTLFQNSLLSGASTFVWDGKNSADQQMPTGEYRVEIIDSSTVIDPATGDPINVVTKEAWVHHEFNCCNTDGVRGDVDNICSASCINILDLNYLIAFIFEGGPAPPCTTEGNVDGIGNITVLDLTYLVDFIFRGGPLPPACP